MILQPANKSYQQFIKVVGAFLEDAKKYTYEGKINLEKERLSYLRLEIILGENVKGPETTNVIQDVEKFTKDFPKTIFKARLYYLVGKRLIKEGKEEQAKKNLELVVNDGSSSAYLKELAKSELSLINIRSKL